MDANQASIRMKDRDVRKLVEGTLQKMPTLSIENLRRMYAINAVPKLSFPEYRGEE